MTQDGDGVATPPPHAPGHAGYLRLREHGFDLSQRVLLMGILNTTPDSFYDGGCYADMPAAVDRARALVAEGADIVDVGGVKAGPGPEVSEEEELARVLPVIEALAPLLGVPVSVDTYRAKVAHACLEAGAALVNDTSGLRDRGMADVVAAHDAGVVLTHLKYPPRTKIRNPIYDDVTGEVRAFLAARIETAVAAGCPPDGIVVDPGMDLGKSARNSVRLLRDTAIFCALGFPVLAATGNKSFIGRITNRPVGDRLEGTIAASVMALILGARILRVHDVARVKPAVDVARAILGLDPAWRDDGSRPPRPQP